MIHQLKFDTALFGYPVGKLDVEESGNFEYSHLAEQAKKFELIYVFSPLPLKSYGLLHDAGVKVNWVKTISKADPFVRPASIQSMEGLEVVVMDKAAINPSESMEIHELSLHCGHFSRFRTDPDFVRDEFGKLYGKWWQESIKKGHEVVAVKKTGKIIGMLIFKMKKDAAHIALFAVLPEMRRHGVGSLLLQQAISMVEQAGIGKIRLSTQKENHTAMSFYNHFGFEIENTIQVYHWRPRIASDVQGTISGKNY